MALDKKWVTQEAYFRLYTTLVGMNVIDVWKSLKILEDDDGTVGRFADVLAQDVIDYAHLLEKEKKESLSASSITSDTGTVTDTYKTNESLTSLSSLSMSKEIKLHTKPEEQTSKMYLVQ